MTELNDNLTRYRYDLFNAIGTVKKGAFNNAYNELRAAIACDRQIFVCGNGGSAAIANHAATDWLKGIRTDTGKYPRVISLSSNAALLTAIANDIGEASMFSYQLESLMRPGDVLVTISSSGNSPNIVAAIKTVQEMFSRKAHTIALSGFDSRNHSTQLADISLHVNASNYGIVEDSHQALMHILSQSLRKDFALPEADKDSFTF